MSLTRSQQMSRIRSRDTKPELILRRILWSRGLRYRLHAKTPFGRPDLVFARKKVAVFVDGCFWHGCPDHYAPPRSQSRFWAEKLRQNVARDRLQTRQLEAHGWRVVRLWEHEIADQLADAAERVLLALNV
jgi:DNA mismatch endonuclease (patch repair protein)